MNNSSFFQECVFVANLAMKHADPKGRGIEYGIKCLKAKRKEQLAAKGIVFNEDKFYGYSIAFEEIAKHMVEGRLDFLEGMRG